MGMKIIFLKIEGRAQSDAFDMHNHSNGRVLLFLCNVELPTAMRTVVLKNEFVFFWHQHSLESQSNQLFFNAFIYTSLTSLQ